MLGPVDGGVHGSKPRESEDDIFTSATHDVEEMFLSDPFDVGIEGAGVVNCTGFVRSLINVSNGDGGGKFFSGEAVFPDKLPVNAGDTYRHQNQLVRRSRRL